MPIKVLVAKPGLDGHDRGAKIVARALRDAGMEVVYTGLHQTPEMIVNAVIQEDDIPKLKAIGVRAIFNAEASTQDLIDVIERIVAETGRDRTRREAAP